MAVSILYFESNCRCDNDESALLAYVEDMYTVLIIANTFIVDGTIHGSDI